MEPLRVEGLSKLYVLGKGKGNFVAPKVIPQRFRREPKSAKAGRELWALKDVTFSVERGTILGIIGANGAGKTTLLKILSRVTLPTEGRATVNGRLVSLLELGAGFQVDSTGRESIYLNAAMLGIPRAAVDERFDEIVAFAEIGDSIDLPMRRYSSGQYVRLAFSVAINLEPDILLADEVLAVGDMVFQERCLQRVEEAGSKGLAVLFVSHDMAAIRRLCDRVIWIDRGQIVRDGDPKSVVKAYEESNWNIFGGRERGSNKSPHGKIGSIKLLSTERTEVGALSVAEDAFVEVRARLDTPGTFARCVLAVSANAAVAFRTAQPEELEVEEPGIYSFVVRIPGHLLADITYSIKVGVQIREGEEYFNLVQHDALLFRVYDTDEAQSARGTYNYTLSGVIRPLLEWEVGRELAPPVELEMEKDPDPLEGPSPPSPVPPL